MCTIRDVEQEICALRRAIVIAHEIEERQRGGAAPPPGPAIGEVIAALEQRLADAETRLAELRAGRLGC